MIEDPVSRIEIVDVEGDKLKSEMKRLSEFTCHFGKYKKRKFKELASDRDYAIWILGKKDFISQNEALKRYLEYYLTTPNN
jgi:hypothetical protein